MTGRANLIRRTVGAAVLALFWWTSDPAAGQPDAAKDDAKAQAQALVDQAFNRIKASDHEGALALFREAYETYPSEKIL